MTHKQTAKTLIIISYIIAMLFFCIARILGIQWFRLEAAQSDIPLWSEYIIMIVSLIFELVVMIMTLTNLPFKNAICVAIIYKFIDMVIPIAWIIYAISYLFIIIIPLIVNKNKKRSLGYSIIYILLLSIYSIIMIFGRGYPLISKFNAIYQVLGVIDYKMFLLFILLMKGEVKKLNPGSGCMLIFDRFGVVADKIGAFLLAPFKCND